MSNEAICKKCYLRYSSYCIGCNNVRYGLNLTVSEYLLLLKTQDKRSDNNA